VIAEITAAADHVDTEDGWRVRLRQRFLAARQVMLRHPWAPGLLHSRKTVPAGVYIYCDGIVGTLVGAGFSYYLAHRAMHALGSLPLGFAQKVFSPASAGGSIEVDTAETDMSAMAATLPHLAAMMAAELHDVTEPARFGTGGPGRRSRGRRRGRRGRVRRPRRGPVHGLCGPGLRQRWTRRCLRTRYDQAMEL
jgi:tetracycline repressor-like protein